MASSGEMMSFNPVHKYTNSLRAMPSTPSTAVTRLGCHANQPQKFAVKVVYTLNENTHQFFLARHTPIAVRVIKKPEPPQRQRQQTTKQSRRQPVTTPIPVSARKGTPTRRSLAAAQANNEVINLDSTIDDPLEEGEEHVEYGFAPLKVCVSAVWAARSVSHESMIPSNSNSRIF
jgi:hypothetical protein